MIFIENHQLTNLKGKNEKVKVMMDKHSYPSKPTGSEVGLLHWRLFKKERHQELGIGLICKLIAENGNTIVPAILNGPKDMYWVEQQIFFIDIDNTNPDYPRETCESIKCTLNQHNIFPNLINETFSSTDEHKRYRVMIICENPIQDREVAKEIIRGLVSLFPQADNSCTDLSRMFFGSNKGILHVDYSSRASKEALLRLYNENACNQSIDKGVKNKKADNNQMAYTARGEQIQKFDLLSFVRKETGETGKKVGNEYMFHTCPICGHQDDFSVNPQKNVFKCFSESCGEGGNIINYLMLTRGIDKFAASIEFDDILSGRHEENCKALQYAAKSESRCDVIDALPTYIEETTHGRLCVNPYLLAEYILKKNNIIFARDSSHSMLHCFWYENDIYRPMSDTDIKGKIISTISEYDKRMVRCADVKSTLELFKDSAKPLPLTQIDNNENIVVFENGVLHLDTMELHAHSPYYHSTIKLPCMWNKEAVEAPLFNEFLDTLTGNDPQVKKLILTCMGIVFSNYPGHLLKAGLFFCGPGDTGKSLLKKLTEAIVGYDNCANVDLAMLESRFGMSELFRKRIAGSADMGFHEISELKHFKQLTGGDTVFADVKNEKGFHFVFNGLLWFCTNQMPYFDGDNGIWVYNRMIIVRCNNVIPADRRDKQLFDKLFKERDAIVYMAINALKEFIDNDCNLVIPDACKVENAKYMRRNSSARAFLEECCENRLASDVSIMITTSGMRKTYENWCITNNCKIEKIEQFKLEAASSFNVSADALIKRTSKNEFYRFVLNDVGKKYNVS